MGLLLARWAPSPCRRLSRPRTTTGPPSRPEAISRQRACPSPPWLGGGKGGLGRFPRSPRTDRRGWRPAIPLQPRHGYAAGLPRGLTTGARNRLRSRRPQVLRSACTAARPTSTRSEPVATLRGFKHWFTLVTPICPRLPGPGRLAVPARPVVVRAASHPPLRFQGQVALGFTDLLRQAGGGLFHPTGLHGASWRTRARSNNPRPFWSAPAPDSYTACRAKHRRRRGLARAQYFHACADVPAGTW